MSVSVSALVFLRHPTSRTMSTRSVSKFSRTAPFKNGSRWNTVLQFPIVFAVCPFCVMERLSLTSSTVSAGRSRPAAFITACLVAGGKS